MKTRSTRYTQPDRHGEAVGVAQIELPFRQLWQDVEQRFYCNVVACLQRGRAVQNDKRLLDELGLGNAALSLAEWFTDYEPTKLQLEQDSVAGLVELAARADDLLRDDGEWREDARELDKPATQAIADLTSRCQELRIRVAANYGQDAAMQCLESVRSGIARAAGKRGQPESWNLDRSKELEKLVPELRAIVHPPSAAKRLLVKVRPGTPLRFVLPDIERSRLEHQIIPVLQRAAMVRFNYERQKRLDDVIYAICGRPGTPGILDEITKGIHCELRYFRELARASSNVESLPRSKAPHQLVVADSLNDVLDTRSGRKVADVYSDALRRANCSPRELADRLRRDGLVVRGRRYLTADWRSYLRPAEVVASLRHEVARYLGSADHDAPLDIAEPSTAFEHAAAITPLHPELRPRLLSLISPWYRQSHPYADVEHLVHAEPWTRRLLYCYPAERGRWLELVGSQQPIANAQTDAAVAESYATIHPYVAILVQYALAVPLGALKTLPDCVSQGNQLRRTRSHESLIDHYDHPETRLLGKRPIDYADSKDLFEAGLAAKVIHAVPGSHSPARYALITVNSALTKIFSPDILAPDLVTDKLLHEQLRDHKFREFTAVTFPHAANFHRTATRLAQELDSSVVSEELIRLGIVQRAAPGHSQLNLPPQSDRNDIPKALFRRTRGPLVGLTAEEFVSRLHQQDDDSLYNALFWRVVDAVELGYFSRNGVPDFASQFIRLPA